MNDNDYTYICIVFVVLSDGQNRDVARSQPRAKYNNYCKTSVAGTPLNVWTCTKPILSRSVEVSKERSSELRESGIKDDRTRITRAVRI